MLIGAGADIHAIDRNGNTVLGIVFKNHRYWIAIPWSGITDLLIAVLTGTETLIEIHASTLVGK